MHRQTEEKKRHELDLLCRAGVGLTAIAPAVCRLVREMVGAEACGLFWMDAQGQPEGFFHEHSTPETQELFLNEYERLFAGPHEINVSLLAKRKGQHVGHLLAPPTRYYHTNTFNLLVRGNGHHHSLDLRVDVDGHARAVLLLFRARGNPFSESDALALTRLEPYLRRALSDAADDPSAWGVAALRSGYLLLSEGGRRLCMLGGEADALLKSCMLVGHDVRLSGPQQVVPRFLREQCVRLDTSRNASLQEMLEIPAGRLVVTLHRLRDPAEAAAPQVLAMLELIQPPRLQIVQQVLALGVSPLQREIALMAGVGGLRPDCERVIGVSREALKKHLKVIYRASGTSDWNGLAAMLRAGGTSAQYA